MHTVREFIREIDGYRVELVTLSGSHSNITVIAGNVTSQEDIGRLYAVCRSLELGQVCVEVTSIYDPIEFVIAGFITHDSVDPSVLVQYVKGSITVEEIWMWHGREQALAVKKLAQVPNWTLPSMARIKQDALDDVDSSWLIMYAPQELYSSLRPRTDMTMFLPPNCARVPRQHLDTGTWTAPSGEVWNVLPVTRYFLGMSRGLYNQESLPGEYCGTFFYHEPESDTFLAYKTSATFFNKTTAMIQLQVPWEDGKDVWLAGHPALDAHISGELPADLRITSAEFLQWYPRQANRRFPAEMLQKMPDRKHYVGALLAYADEDSFDQPICIAAKKRGIDVVILTHMVGSHQVVTEVLDTRDRVECFENLVTATY